MVSSFRNSVTSWLSTVRPAALYVRSAGLCGGRRQPPGVERMGAQRTLALNLDAGKPTVALLVRELKDAPGNSALPLVGDALAVPAGQLGVHVSEAMLDLHGARWARALRP